MSDARLIERWLPIAALSEESVRERRSMTALPPIYYLHVWWARRPLVASRAAILASLLPSDADHEMFMRLLGIHGDPVAAKRQLDRARRTGVRVKDPYGYPRAFSYTPSRSEKDWFEKTAIGRSVADPTAGGGSIPFESTRLGLETIANDLNPVAATILQATIEYPVRFGNALVSEYDELAAKFRKRVADQISWAFPQDGAPNEIDTTYLWARSITCPYCSGKVPLSPNWRVAAGGVGVRLRPNCAAGPGGADRFCDFELVTDEAEHSAGTISTGDATCPFPDCGRIIDGSEVKKQAQSGEMGDQLFAVVYKRRVENRLSSGKRGVNKWEWCYRAPRTSDDNLAAINLALEERKDRWEAFDVLPTEEIWSNGRGSRVNDPGLYGSFKWRDMFSPRQLLGHGVAVETFYNMFDEDQSAKTISDIRRAAYLYLSLTLDKLVDYGSRFSTWDWTTGRVRHVFVRHEFSFKWSYAEMATVTDGLGYDWAIEQTSRCLQELIELCSDPASDNGTLFADRVQPAVPPAVSVTCKPGDALDHVETGTVDAVVMDPPYGANVMYAELSDFFYVWLKRTAGRAMPELFTRYLTDKDSEAVANRSKYKGEKGADALATREYRDKMASIFLECHRILKSNGIMTVMFTHKDTSAWDALTKGLIEAGFIITASWPVNTEAEGSLHIKDKAAANSTIFLVCRPRPADQGGETTYWEDVEPLVAKAVRTRVEEFQKAGIGGVDLYLASFGPALEEFSRHWPLKRGTPRPEPQEKKRRKQSELFEEEFDPYAVTPEDALDAARGEVKTWRLNQLTHTKGRGDLDATTSWFVLAWDAFKAPVFSYDEGLRLARAVGADLDGQLIGKICEKKGSDIKLWDSATRAAKSGLGPADGSRAMIDAIHHAAHRGRTRTLDAALDLLKDAGIDNDPQFLAALEAVLEVLPPSRNFVGFEVATGDAKSAADDFDALEKLRRLAFSDRVDEPQQLLLFAEEAA